MTDKVYTDIGYGARKIGFGNRPGIAVVDFQDVINPTSFKVLLYNTSGVRVSGNFTWQCRGT